MRGHIRERSPGHWAIILDIHKDGQRKRKWFRPKDAAKRVDSPELSELIRQSAKRALQD